MGKRSNFQVGRKLHSRDRVKEYVMPSSVDWILKKASKTIAEYVCNIKPGEHVLVYTDTEGDFDVASSVAEAASLAGGEVTFIVFPTRKNVDMEPPAPMAAAMREANVVIDLPKQYIVHTKAFKDALDHGARVFCIAAGGTKEVVKRCIGSIDYPKVLELGEALKSILEKTSKVRITSPAGTDLEMDITGRTIDHASTVAKAPGEQSMLAGQVSWYPFPTSLNGKIVFDGTVWPPAELGILRSPITLTIEEAWVKDISGSGEARIYRKWFECFNNKNIYKLAHISAGLNPGAKLTGNILEDERIFAGIEIGIGANPIGLAITEVPFEEEAKGHTDGVMLTPTLELDGVVAFADGEIKHPELLPIVKSIK